MTTSYSFYFEFMINDMCIILVHTILYSLISPRKKKIELLMLWYTNSTEGVGGTIIIIIIVIVININITVIITYCI